MSLDFYSYVPGLLVASLLFFGYYLAESYYNYKKLKKNKEEQIRTDRLVATQNAQQDIKMTRRKVCELEECLLEIKNHLTDVSRLTQETNYKICKKPKR